MQKSICQRSKAKAIAAIVLIVAMIFTAMPQAAQAAENQTQNEENYQQNISMSEPAMYGNVIGRNLSPEAKIIYDDLKEQITQVARGERESTVFSLEKSCAKLRWTKSDLGLADSAADYEVRNAIHAKTSIIIAQAAYAVWYDMPYECYWFGLDEDESSYPYYDPYSAVGEITKESGTAVYGIKNIDVSYYVSEDYKKSGSTDAHTVDTEKTMATASAVENAKRVVEKYKDLGDIEKLRAYRDYIMRTGYNDAALDPSTPYGDPWQLIHVFDKNPDGNGTDDLGTQVVCEGYSKAFKFLCDMSNFSGDLKCYQVSGQIYVRELDQNDSAIGGGMGRHMWNVLSYNGKNYIVDITNCPKSNRDFLFLDGVEPTEYAQNNNEYRKFRPVSGAGNVVKVEYRYAYSVSMQYIFNDIFPEMSSARLSDEEVSTGKLNQNIYFDQSYIVKTVGDGSFTSKVNGVKSGEPVSYQSSNTDVAEVDNSGNVTIKAVGETTITAAVGDNEKYKGSSASYKLRVYTRYLGLEKNKLYWIDVNDAEISPSGAVKVFADDSNKTDDERKAAVHEEIILTPGKTTKVVFAALNDAGILIAREARQLKEAADSNLGITIQQATYDDAPTMNIPFGCSVTAASLGEGGISSTGGSLRVVSGEQMEVIITRGSNMTKADDSGDESQNVCGEAITPIVYTANTGYYFPNEGYPINQSGITVSRESADRITVSGTPTADVALTLPDALRKQKEETPSISLTAVDDDFLTITGVETGMKYGISRISSVDGTLVWKDITDVTGNTATVSTGLKDSEERGMYWMWVYKPASDDSKLDSDPQSVKFFKQALPSVSSTDCISSENNDGKLINVTNNMEYKKSDDSDWRTCTPDSSFKMTGLSNGTYYVRAKAKNDDGTAELASAVTTVVIKASKQTPVAIPTGEELVYNGSEQIGVNPGAEYTLTGAAATDAGSYTATATLDAGYKWDDGTSEPKVIEFTIAKASQDAPAGLAAEPQTSSGGKGKITGTAATMEYRKVDSEVWTTCTDGGTYVDPGAYVVRYKESHNYNAGAESAQLTVAPAGNTGGSGGSGSGGSGSGGSGGSGSGGSGGGSSGSGGGGGGSTVPSQKPAAQTPVISADKGADVVLDSTGTTAKINVKDDSVIISVKVNGEDRGAVEELSGLKSGDKIEVVAMDKKEFTAKIKDTKNILRSEIATTKNGKKGIKIKWNIPEGLRFDGFDIYRSTKKTSGYGKKPLYTTASGNSGYYVNSKSLKKGTKYYYKIRGFVVIDGKKVYTEYSTKASRTFK